MDDVASIIRQALAAGPDIPPLFPFEGALVTGDDKVAWVSNDSSKPRRPTNGAPGGVQCWVVQCTAGSYTRPLFGST